MSSSDRTIRPGESWDCEILAPGRGARFRARVEIATRAGIVLQVPAGVLSSLRKGLSIRVVYGRGSSGFEFQTRVDEFSKQGGEGSIRIPVPTQVRPVDRRRGQRQEVNGTVTFRAASGRGSSYAGKLRNLSDGGLQFSTMFGGLFGPGSKPVGLELSVDASLPGHEFTGLTGTVRHAYPDPTVRHIVVVNLEFTLLSASDRGRIARIVGR